MPANICASRTCNEQRVEGSYFCATHMAERRRSSSGSQMVCPHCQTKGHVSTKKVKRKQGISGGKATGAVLTAGLSLFATGLSRKQLVTEAHCSNCGATWSYA